GAGHARARHRRIDSHPGGGLRSGRPETDRRRSLDRRRHPAVGDDGSRRPVDAQRRRRRAPLPRAARPRGGAARAAFEGALERLRAAGAYVDDIEIHHAGDIATIYLHLVLAEAAAYHAHTLETMADRYTAPVRLRLEMGRYILAEDYV